MNSMKIGIPEKRDPGPYEDPHVLSGSWVPFFYYAYENKINQFLVKDIQIGSSNRITVNLIMILKEFMNDLLPFCNYQSFVIIISLGYRLITAPILNNLRRDRC